MLSVPQKLVVVDLFAGGGGASEGIRQALGVAPRVAINHDADAIEMHARNHPGTLHLCEDLLRVKPFRPVRGKPIHILWGSPDCTHHSRAKGGRPLESGRRMLAWVILEWAREVSPHVIILENVQEFEQWGPLGEDGRPIESRKGETFREFVNGLRLAGYRVEWRVLNAADYGAPTARRRLFMIARCDGEAIRWPEPTHGPERANPWRTAAECIDWTLPCPSIFGREKELAEATQRRIAAGVQRYVLQTASPFLVRYQGERRVGEAPRTADLSEPLPTQTTEPRFGLVVPSLIQTGYGERPTQAPRVLDIHAPLGTVVAGGQKHGLVAAFLAKHQGSGPDWKKAIGQDLRGPVHTVTATDTKSLVQAQLSEGADLGNGRLVAAFLTKFYGDGGQLQRVDEPLHTIPTLDRFGLVSVEIDGTRYVVTDIGMRMLQPRELATAQGFGPEYILTGSKRNQVARIGNSVCPPVARAIVQAQFGEAPDLEVQAA